MASAYGHALQLRPVEWAKLAVNRSMLAKATAIVAWSRWAAESVTNQYGVPSERVHTIYPGVDLELFRAPDQTRERPAGPVRILFVGGDFVRKGGCELLTAVAELGGVELDVVTSTTDIAIPPDLPVRIHHDVSANSRQMADLYERADVFALPSLGDCTPLALAEAMASGLPVVATTVGSISGMIHDGHNGVLVPPGDSVALANALRSLVENPARRRRFGLASRTLAVALHDTRSNCREIFNLMRAAAGSERPRRAQFDGTSTAPSAA
jgi:glycosyltransferase involved in cell wall biosynthesis